MEFKETYHQINPHTYLKKFAAWDWYLKLQPELEEYFYNYDRNKADRSPDWFEKREEFIKMVSELLDAGRIALGDSGIDWDKERKPIDTLVIHHSSTPPNTSLQVINALGLIRLYAPVYSRENTEQFGQPIWSNHFYKGKLTFIPYHYIIKQDGTTYQILKDEAIGWHAGNWEVNCRSVAICFLDDLKEKKPTTKAIRAARKIIKKYPQARVLGHNEVSEKTSCPGKLFLGENGWKKLLVSEDKSR